MNSYRDEPETVRAGQELAEAKLAEFLASSLPGLNGKVSVRQFQRGYSNLTYLVTMGDRELVVRRAPPGVSVKSGHDMGREFRVLSGLHPTWPKVPKPLALCLDRAVLGTPFYVMERVPGVILRASNTVQLDEKTMRDLSLSLTDTLAEIHSIDLNATRLSDLGKPDGYLARQIMGWSERYRAVETDDIPEMDRVAQWLARNIPKAGTSGAALIHNDFKFDNVVLRDDSLTSVAAVLDWEMATVGDPHADLGTTLAYWVEANDAPELTPLLLGPTNLPGALSRMEVVARYEERTKTKVKNLVFHYASALYKLAVVAQQLYKRHRDGKSTDVRLARMREGVRGAAAVANRAVDHGRIDRLG